MVEIPLNYDLGGCRGEEGRLALYLRDLTRPGSKGRFPCDL